MKISLILPCYFYNETIKAMTMECISSLRFGSPDQLIVVDDGSPLKSDLSTLVLPQNLGYTGAVNAGFKEATGDVIIVGNNDLVFTPGWLEAILKPLDMGYDISSIRTSDNGYETEDKITEGDKFGSIFAMKRQVYDTIGGFDPIFRGYFSDLDYRRRAINAGFKIAKNHAGLVEHQSKATYSLTDPEDREFNTAKDIFIKKHGVVGDDLAS